VIFFFPALLPKAENDIFYRELRSNHRPFSVQLTPVPQKHQAVSSSLDLLYTLHSNGLRPLFGPLPNKEPENHNYTPMKKWNSGLTVCIGLSFSSSDILLSGTNEIQQIYHGFSFFIDQTDITNHSLKFSTILVPLKMGYFNP